MRALSIDTSTHRASVVLWEDGTCLAREYNVDPARHAEALIGLIDRALATAGWNKTQIDLIASCVGPGSFTGLRVGLATAKGIALALDRPIIGVGSLEAMAAAAFAGPWDSASAEGAAVVALLDARKEEVFWAAYAADGAKLAGPGHLRLEGIGAVWELLAERRIMVVGEVAAQVDRTTPAIEIHRSLETDLPDAAVVARVAAARLEREGRDDLDALEPIYVRPPDITPPNHPSAVRQK